MKILLLCEGDAEAAHASFSGITKSLVDHLRAARHQIQSCDVDLYGIRKFAAAAATAGLNRRRWGVRFHLGGVPFRMRSRLAAHRIAAAGAVDAILQIGATFSPVGRGNTPYFLFCDSNIRMAERGRVSGQSQAASLTPEELEGIARREATVYERAAGVFTLSDRLRRSFIDDFHLTPERVHTVHAGPNFDPAAVPAAGDRHRNQDHPPTVLFVGANFERKGGDILLRAFRRVRKLVPGARLLIVGPRDLQVDEPGVELFGFLRKDDPNEWTRLVDAYTRADVFCLPTRFEPFGIVFIEAMFFGLPCVGPDAWAIPEMVQDGVTGFLIPPEDESALTDRLLTLLREPELARRMGRAGREKARSHFTWTAVADRVTQVMRGVVGTTSA
jgi:starch synthase